MHLDFSVFNAIIFVGTQNYIKLFRLKINYKFNTIFFNHKTKYIESTESKTQKTLYSMLKKNNFKHYRNNSQNSN